MTLDHFDRFFYLSAAGLGLLLAGGLNLALGRRTRLRAVVTLMVCLGVLGGLFSFTRSELAIRAAWVLGGGLLAAVLLGSERFSRNVASVFTALRRPAARWGLLAVAGLVTVVASVIAFEWTDTEIAEQHLTDLELTTGRPPSQPSERANATTDRGTLIVLREPITPRDAGQLSVPEAKVLQNHQLTDQVIRRGAPTEHSNCHGWVFTGGKFLLGPDDVELILKENGYQEVIEPRVGDVVVYRLDGAVSHTAVVRYVAEGQPVMVESKWGTMGVFLHPANKSTYGQEFTFHRSARGGHLLVGLGGSPGPANAIPPGIAE